MSSSLANPNMPSERFTLLINRDFALLWVGQTISVLGDFFLSTTAIIWITTRLAVGMQWLPAAVTGEAVATALPALLIGPFAGVFVDRLDARRMLIVMDAIRAIAVLLFIAIVAIIPMLAGRAAHLWLIGALYGMTLLIGVCEQFFGPARLVLLRTIVPQTSYARAVSAQSLGYNVGLLIAPALAAPLYLLGGVPVALLIDALSFVASGGLILLIAAPAAVALPDHAERHFWREFREGARHMRENQVLWVLVMTGIISSLGTGAFNALYLLFGLQNLHTPAALLGFYGAIYGLGVIVGLPPAVWIAQRVGEVRLLWSSLVVYGILMLLVARMTQVVPGLVGFALLGMANAGVNVTVQPLMLRATPHHLLGRVQSLSGPLIMTAGLTSQVAAGLLTSTILYHVHVRLLGMHIGPLDTILTATGILAIIAGSYTYLKLARGAAKP